MRAYDLEYITPEQYIPGTIASIQRQKRPRGNPRTRYGKYYKDVICTFDIETTRLEDVEQSIMYVWMLHLHHHVTIVGRTWQQLNTLWNQFSNELGDDNLLIFVHNLSYEFQFLRAIHHFSQEEVFSVESRKVLKCAMTDKKIDFLCSYLHSNMSLAEYTKKMGVFHVKQSGDEFDYNKKRYPWTPLTEKEMYYALCDVVGQAEAIEAEMLLENDNFYTLPLTSTGYVRRDAKEAMRKSNFQAKNILPTFDIYEMCREAFRGGDTHANRYYSGRILSNVKSADRSSSYPDVICNCKFPVTKFQLSTDCSAERLIELISVRKRAVLFRVAFSGVRLIDEFWGAPYLSRDKCRRIAAGKYDNGRILSADYLETTLTDVDFTIILQQYQIDDICPIKIAYARYGYLPNEIRDLNIEYYRRKTELKGVEGQEVFYMKSKNKLNSVYGMMAQDPVKQDILFINEEWTESQEDEKELLEAYNKKAFLPYQWGVWVTAWARFRLQEGIRLAGDNFVYCDTDSVKYLGEIDWTAYNRERIEDSNRSGAYATDPKGVTHYMGVYEDDGHYNEFITLGSKKYAYNFEPGGESHVTVSGVNKCKGGKELDKHGGLHAFKPGFVFAEAGGTESVYNDEPEIRKVEREGNPIFITPNIVIRDSTYTLGITAEYAALLDVSNLPIDIYARLW